MGGETFKQAYDRGRTTVTHLVQIVDSEDDEIEEVEDEWESEGMEERREDVFAIRDVEGGSYNVEQTKKQIATRRHEVLEGAYPPPFEGLGIIASGTAP